MNEYCNIYINTAWLIYYYFRKFPVLQWDYSHPPLQLGQPGIFPSSVTLNEVAHNHTNICYYWDRLLWNLICINVYKKHALIQPEMFLFQTWEAIRFHSVFSWNWCRFCNAQKNLFAKEHFFWTRCQEPWAFDCCKTWILECEMNQRNETAFYLLWEHPCPSHPFELLRQTECRHPLCFCGTSTLTRLTWPRPVWRERPSVHRLLSLLQAHETTTSMTKLFLH